MNIGKLGKQLRREVTANPKKAAVLGLLGLVAMYFWAPLLAGWFVKDGKPTATTAVAKPPIPAATSPVPKTAETASATTAKAKESQPTWQEIVAWMEVDPRTRPAFALAPSSNPFRASKIAASAPVRRTTDPQPTTRDVTPQTLNLVLSSTIVGGGSQAARINGKTFRPGDLLKVKTGGGQNVEFRIVRVDVRTAVLERSGKQYELKIEPAKRSGTIEFAKMAQ